MVIQILVTWVNKSSTGVLRPIVERLIIDCQVILLDILGKYHVHFPFFFTPFHVTVNRIPGIRVRADKNPLGTTRKSQARPFFFGDELKMHYFTAQRKYGNTPPEKDLDCTEPKNTTNHPKG